MKCNNCNRSALWILKLTFYPSKKNLSVGSSRLTMKQAPTQVRYGLTFEAEGGWCQFHKERHTKRKGLLSGGGEIQNFELCAANTRQEIATLFDLRGWGEPAWEDTVLDWVLITPAEKESGAGTDKASDETPTVKMRV